MIYVDEKYHCHITNPDGTYREIETNAFDGKCAQYIEGFCYDDSKGYVQIYPWKPYDELDAAQRDYERQLIEKQAAELAELDALVLELQYNAIL